MKCKLCGHKLSNPESIKRGYGKTCYRIIQLNKSKVEEESLIEELQNEILILKEQINSIGKYIRIGELTNNNTSELLNRIKRLELDNNFMKHQLRNKVFINRNNGSKDSSIDWDIPEEIKEIKDRNKIQFNVVVKELKIMFHEDFDYHEILIPVNPIEEPVMVEVLV